MAGDTNITDTALDPDSPDDTLFNYVEWVTDSGSIIEVSFDITNWTDELLANFQVPASKVLDLILCDLEKPSATVSLLMCSDTEMQKLNDLHRGLNKPTNVLSFSSLNAGDSISLQASSQMLGDIVIAAETVVEEACDLQIPLVNHLVHLFVHGILHLFDYDHVDDTMAEVMESMETNFLLKIGISNPYQEIQKELYN